MNRALRVLISLVPEEREKPISGGLHNILLGRGGARDRRDDVVQLVGMQNEYVIEAFPFQAPDEAFADRRVCSSMITKMYHDRKSRS